MKVFKFGGASVKDATAVKNVASILAGYPADHLVVVVSAMGKTTNLLETLVKSHFNRWDETMDIYREFRSYHEEIAKAFLAEIFLKRSFRCLMRWKLNFISHLPCFLILNMTSLFVTENWYHP
jgi:aspartokinase